MKKILKMIIAIMITFMFLSGCNIPDNAQLGSVTIDGQLGAKAFVNTNQTGTDSDGYFYSFWTDSQGTVSMNMNGGGKYSTQWNNTNNFVSGKGKEKGSILTYVDYSGSFNVTGGDVGYLCLYGWMTNPTDSIHPVVEYYIVENYGNWTPPGNVQSVGTVYADGGIYNLYRTEQIDKPWIVDKEEGTFYQYWSVRTQKRSSGKITFSKHVNAWKNNGWNMGSFGTYYQILATEGYQSSGNSNVTINKWVKKGRAGTRRRR